MKHFYSFIFWPLFFISQLIALSLITWHLVAQINFAYPVGYQLLNLDQHIAEYAPLNRYKKDFEFVSKQEHWRLFGEICDAIQHHGKDLADIRYPLRNGQATSFMHQNEIIHLQDVANLIDGFYSVGELALIIWLIGWLFIYWKKLPLPSTKKIIIVFLISLGIITLAVLAAGAKDVFYWMHTKIFPNGHQWFFYYQDSLMTTLMKAPDIFAFIATVLFSTLIGLWVLSTLAIKKSTKLIMKNKPKIFSKNKH